MGIHCTAQIFSLVKQKLEFSFTVVRMLCLCLNCRCDGETADLPATAQKTQTNSPSSDVSHKHVFQEHLKFNSPVISFFLFPFVLWRVHTNLKEAFIYFFNIYIFAFFGLLLLSLFSRHLISSVCLEGQSSQQTCSASPINISKCIRVYDSNEADS